MPRKRPAIKRTTKKKPSTKNRLAGKAFASALIYPDRSRGTSTAEDPRKAIARGQLAAIRDTLCIKTPELAALFGVRRQAVEQWIKNGVPISQIATADRLYEVVDELARRFKPQRLPAIVRGPMPILGGRSILETLVSDGPAAIFEFFYRWASYVPDVSPVRVGEFRDTTR